MPDSLPPPRLRVPVALALLLACGAAAAQTAAPPLPPAPLSGLPTTIQLPELGEVKLPLPRSVRAANALIGLTRQRLALVVGSDGAGTLAAASRDTQAVAAALRAGGFVVMVREDLGADDLRANLKEFRERLQAGGIGFAYFTGLAAQVDGRNYVLPRGLPLDDDKQLPARLQSGAVPLQEIVDAVQGSDDSPRYLVVDAAYAHPALAALPRPGLAEQKVQPGTLGLFAQSPGVVAAPPAADALPTPLPADPRQLAASPFGRELVRALLTPRATGPEVLRSTRAAVLDLSAGKQAPVIVGDGSSKDEFAEPELLEALFQRKPEEIANDALQRALRASSGGGAGDVAVSQVLAPAGASVAPAGSGGSALASTALSAAGTTASVGAGVAGTAALIAAGAKAVEASAAASVVAAAVGVAGSMATALVSSAASALAGSPSAPAAAAAEAAEAALPAAAPRTAVPDSMAASALAAAPPAATQADALPAALPRAAVPDTAAATALPGAGAMPVSAFQQPADARTQRLQGGGERPVYVPRVNPFGYAEGDTFTYQVLDTWKDRVIGTAVQSIDEVLPDGRLLANDRLTEMDPQGRIKATRNLDGSRSQFQPCQDLWWSDPKVGQRRDVSFDEVVQRADHSRGETEWKGSLSVGTPRRIELPAGEFDVLPIKGSGWFYEKTANGPVRGQWSRTVWYAPKLGHPVAIDIEDANAVGKLLRRERVELTHAQTSRSP